ncbi:hypothetical protein, partial [Brenneria goodwinii]|uniref:hypothetical protein n=1 Tax=Brenneria goodwinii TaxID=1109412 RepID=UPI001EFACA07
RSPPTAAGMTGGNWRGMTRGIGGGRRGEISRDEGRGATSADHRLGEVASQQPRHRYRRV